MLAKRLAALVAAAGLVVVALMVRQAMDDGGDDSASTDDPSSTAAPDGDRVTLVCDTALADACRSVAERREDLTVVVEDAGVTAARVQSGDAASAWLTFAPQPAMVERYRALADLPVAYGPAEAVASSPLVITARTERLAALAGSCAPAVSWACVGDAAGQPWSAVGGQPAWGEVKPAHDDPIRSAVGLLVLANLVVDERGTSDIATIDLQADEEFVGWLQTVERAALNSAGGATALDRLLTTGEVDVTGVPDAVLDQSIGAQGTAFDRVASPAQPVADVVLVAPEGARLPGDLAEDLTGALLSEGWDGPRAEAPGTGLPTADVMIALQQLWKDVT
jgi:hypothetical protein